MNLVTRIVQSRRFQGVMNKKRIRAINDMPEMAPGYTELFGGIHFIDAASFKSQYQEIVVREIFRFESKNDTPLILDLGANIGLGIRWWKYFWPQSEIHAYEPSPSAFDALVKNTKNLSKTMIYKKAVVGSPGELRLYDFGADASRIMNPIANSQNYITVEAVTLSSILASVEMVDLLKIDIEVAELDVIREAKQGLSKVRSLFVEFHSFDLGPNFGELLNLLMSQGFQVYPEARERLHKPFLSVPNDRGIAYTVNIWAWREG